MKKVLSLILCLGMVLLISGCGSSNSSNGVVSCVSEKVGEDPSTVYYEEYVVKNNKVVEFDKYSIISYSDEYLTRVSLDDALKIFSKDTSYDVSKVNDNQLKLVYKNPVNVFETSQAEDLVEFIVTTMEENEFALYTYTCEVK